MLLIPLHFTKAALTRFRAERATLRQTDRQEGMGNEEGGGRKQAAMGGRREGHCAKIASLSLSLSTAES